MSTHNMGFYEDLTKIIFELSSNTHLISSAGLMLDLAPNCLQTLSADNTSREKIRAHFENTKS